VRWDAQRLDVDDATTLPGMPSIRGLLRSVQVPEFPGLTLHEVRCRSALNHVPGESAMPFPWTINPFRGCAHSCVYCLSGDTRVGRPCATPVPHHERHLAGVGADRSTHSTGSACWRASR